MKKLISLALSILLLSSLIACEKEQNESSSLEVATITTPITTTTKGSSSKAETTEPEFHLFDEDMIANFDGYKSCQYEDDVCIIKAKIPESWSYRLYEGRDATAEHEASPDCGLDIYKDENNNPRYYKSIISITRFKWSHSFEAKDYDNQEDFTTLTGLNGTLASSIHNNLQGCIFLKNRKLILIFIGYTEKDIFEKNKQEIFNVLNSIEIEMKE